MEGGLKTARCVAPKVPSSAPEASSVASSVASFLRRLDDLVDEAEVFWRQKSSMAAILAHSAMYSGVPRAGMQAGGVYRGVEGGAERLLTDAAAAAE